MRIFAAVASKERPFLIAYIEAEGAHLEKRYLTDVAGLGKLTSSLLSSLRVGAMASTGASR